MDGMGLCQWQRKTEPLNWNVEQETLKALAPPVLVHDDVQCLSSGLLLQQVGHLELEGISNGPYVEEWCIPQIAGYKHLEGLWEASVWEGMEGVDDDWNGALRTVQDISDMFGSQSDVCAGLIATPWSVGNSTCRVELVVREGDQPSIDYREEGLQGLCEPALL